MPPFIRRENEYVAWGEIVSVLLDDVSVNTDEVSAPV
jgi:hypothetical protein